MRLIYGHERGVALPNAMVQRTKMLQRIHKF